MSKKVFLGGTCAGHDWRSDLMPKLKIDYFNPVVSDWNAEAQHNELRERASADYVLYVITPGIRGVYSIAEVTDDSNKRPKKTVFCIHETNGTFDRKMMKSLDAVGRLVERNGGVYTSFDHLPEVLV